MSLSERFKRSSTQWTNPETSFIPNYLEDVARQGWLNNYGPESGLPPRHRPSMDQAIKYHMKQKARWAQVEQERNEWREHAAALQQERDQLLHGLHQARDSIVTLNGRLKQQNSKRVVIDEHREHTSDRTRGPDSTVLPQPAEVNPSEQQQGSSGGGSELPVEVLPTAGDANPSGHPDKHGPEE